MSRIKRPLLSVCIPTYNRSKLLDSLLETLYQESLIHEHHVEIVVSDNCSDDPTQDLLHRWALRMPIKVNRWSKNIGGSLNVLSIPSLASGEFCIIIGDDDLFAPGALQNATNLITRHEDVSLFAIGYSYQPSSLRDSIVALVLDNKEIEVPKSNYTLNKKGYTKERWGEILALSDRPANLTAIPSFIFRRSEWIDKSQRVKAKITVSQSMNLNCVEAAFPHSIIWIEMASKGAMYIDTRAYTYFFVGEQEWFAQKWNAMLLGLCVELATKMRYANAGESYVRYYLELIARVKSSFFILFNMNDYAKSVLRPRRTIKELGFSRMAWTNIQSCFCSESISFRIRCSSLLFQIVPACMATKENMVVGTPFILRMIKYTIRHAGRRLLNQLSFKSYT